MDDCSHLNGRHTIFGQLVAGHETLSRIAEVQTDKNDVPIQPVLVSRCGELEKKTRQRQDPTGNVNGNEPGRRRKSRISAEELDDVDESRTGTTPPVEFEKVPGVPRARRRKSDHSGDDRGRRRKSDISGDEMDTGSTPPQDGRRSRRQSDNMLDEGLRGRPRARSKSRSASNPIEEEDESSDHSPTKMHKRKRSPSPSRHMDRRDESAEPERRRRSLPNQYRNRNDDTDRYRPSPRRNEHRHAGRRDDNRYRPSRDRYGDSGRLNDDGRLGGGGGGGGGYDGHQDAPVKFKGRGVMKYRENDRAW